MERTGARAAIASLCLLIVLPLSSCGAEGTRVSFDNRVKAVNSAEGREGRIPRELPRNAKDISLRSFPSSDEEILTWSGGPLQTRCTRLKPEDYRVLDGAPFEHIAAYTRRCLDGYQFTTKDRRTYWVPSAR